MGGEVSFWPLVRPRHSFYLGDSVCVKRFGKVPLQIETNTLQGEKDFIFFFYFI